MSKLVFCSDPEVLKAYVVHLFIELVNMHKQKNLAFAIREHVKKKCFFLKIEKNAWNVLNQKIMQKYFVTFLQWYPVKTFQSSFPLEQFFFLFQNHPFQAFLVSRYLYI